MSITLSLELPLTEDAANRFAAIALGHLHREFPHKADHVYTDASDSYRPKDVHPVFYGSFDWHSCVHGYWTLARLWRLYPTLDLGPEIKALFDTQLVSEKVEVEVAYLERPTAQGFERPYGWAWLLKLATELHQDPKAQSGALALAPLARAMADRFKAYLPKQTYPVRAGTHANSAFALRLAADYADAFGDQALTACLIQAAKGWYSNDLGAQAWEPGGDDFLSPSLSEAQAMKRLLSNAEFIAWFTAFMPDLKNQHPQSLFTPAQVSDRSDYKIAHLDGLNLSRAWAWAELAEGMPDPLKPLLLQAAKAHFEAAIDHVSGDYAGEHWLASFALLAITERHKTA